MMGAIASQPGTVACLAVGHGDIKLSFDPNNPAERIRAARVVKDMLKRGYAILVEIDVNGEKKFQRAHDFREDVCEYLIADFDPVTAAAADAAEGQQDGQQNKVEAGDQEATETRAGKGRVRHRAVKAETARSVAVAPTAGG